MGAGWSLAVHGRVIPRGISIVGGLSPYFLMTGVAHVVAARHGVIHMTEITTSYVLGLKIMHIDG